MLATGRGWPDRLWAVEGCNGVGRHIAQRLVADGEPIVDVPAKLSARARLFSTGQGRKTDATDAHSVAVVALRTPGLRSVQVDDTTVALRLLVDRRDELGAARTWTVNRLHWTGWAGTSEMASSRSGLQLLTTAWRSEPTPLRSTGKPRPRYERCAVPDAGTGPRNRRWMPES